MARTLIVIGLIVVALGMFRPWPGRLALGHLPGGVVIQRPGFGFYFPITTIVLVGAVVLFLVWLCGR